MSLIATSIRAPVGVAVGVIMVIMFGVLSFQRVPVQLTPDIDKTSITVETVWPGASPREIEREIVDRQEEQLKSIEGLVKMTSESKDSVGTVILEFPVGSDTDALLVKVANKLEQVREYPELAEEPTVSNIDVRSGAIAWFVLQRRPGNERDINTYRDLCEDVIQPAFERVQGVARSGIFGGTERQLLVTIDAEALSARRIAVGDVVEAIRRENRNVSAGDFDEGKRRYIVRTTGEFETPDDVASIVVAQDGGQAVYLRDIAEVRMDYKDPDFTVRHFGMPSIAMNCQRATGANVLEVMTGLERTVVELNENDLAPRGLVLTQVYDETIYIYSALSLIKQNMVVGGLLAVAVLFIFLRSFSAVVIVAVAIPISIVGAFLALFVLGRNINVISLAGMSFAVGMVVDNSIVVLENIFRHRQMGKGRAEAALEGAREVWGAVFASTLTTMAVFIPILFMVEEIGQLFRDIAIAISAAVVLSLVVSVSVIPAMAAKIIGGDKGSGVDGRAAQGGPVARAIAGLVHAICGSVAARLAVVVGLTAASLTVTAWLLPPAEYLPQGNRNLVFGILLPPPGYNLEELTSMGRQIETSLEPHFPSYGGRDRPEPRDPAIENFFFVASGRNVFMGAIAADARQTAALIPQMYRPLGDVPGLIPVIFQASLFGNEIGKGRSIEVEISGPELGQLVMLGGRTFGQLMGLFPGAQIRPIPGLDLGNPEVTITPDRLLAAQAGLGAAELGVVVDVLLDGRKVGDYKHEGEEIDLVLQGRSPAERRSQDFATLPLIAADGQIVTLGSIANIVVRSGPEQINHVERRRTITISLSPPADVPMETAMATVRDDVIAPLRRGGELDGPYDMRMTGTADKLEVTRKSLQGKFILAVAISYLLMAALFESFLYPLVILFSVPLAAVGGVAGLRLVNVATDGGQPLDTLTMLGFIILVGTVVNNAILIVHQALNLVRDADMAARDAIAESVRTRVRPIFMSTLTSVLGMAPLILFPGAGSELYRGIGSVVVGGLLMSTVFTLIVIPALFSLVLGARRHLFGGQPVRQTPELPQ